MYVHDWMCVFFFGVCVLHKSQNASDIAFLWIMLFSKKMKIKKKYEVKKHQTDHMLLITLYAEPNKQHLLGFAYV